MGALTRMGNIAFGIAIFVALGALPVVFFWGVGKSSEIILPPLISLGWIVLAIVVVVLLPLSLFKRLRSFTGTSIFISSYLFGLIGFLISLLTTWSLWGGFWAFIGMAMLGGAVVPFALLASGIEGMWSVFFIIIGVLVLTYASRVIGLLIAERV